LDFHRDKDKERTEAETLSLFLESRSKMHPKKNNPLLPVFIAFLLSLFMLQGCGPGERSGYQVVIGQPVPEFALTDIKGREWRLSELRGKVIFINFWASWCRPCLEEMPSMEVLNRRLPDTSFQMLAILYNDRPEFANTVAEKIGFTAPIIVDTGSEMGSQYGITGVPETFIVDTQGVLREKFIGPQKWDSPETMAMLEQYLPQTSTHPATKSPSLPPGT
jgi:peroxiredoxin